MGPWLARRLLQSAATFAVVVVLLFVLMRLAPGDPLTRLQDGRQMTQEEIEWTRKLYGLDRPTHVQFADFLRGVGRGELGTSIAYGLPVTTLIASRLPATLLLGGTVLLLNFTLGLWLGVRQAVRRGSREDRWLTGLSLTGYAIPSFWLGLVLAWAFGVELRWLPSGGMSNPLLPVDADPVTRILDVASHLLLPAVTLSAVTIAGTMRYQRGAMLEVLRLPYMVTARAKGLRESAVTWRHAWRNALFPIVTLFGLWLPVLVTGSVFVETVFVWPGLGSLAAGAVGGRDYPLLMGTSLLAAGLVISANLVTDVAYAALDPRVRYS
jgi:peptide/nickel transport system permease protein